MNKIKALLLAIPLIVLMVTPINAAGNFTDLATNHWAVETIQWGTDQAVIHGYPDGTFRPEATVTEAEFLAMLERSFIEMTDGTPWYKPYYDLANQNNYPVTSTPDNVILRNQVAEIVAGTQGVNYTGDNAIQYLLGKGLAKGYDANIVSIPNYHGADTLNRAQAVQFIKNLKDAGIDEIKARPFAPSPVSELPELPCMEQPSTSYSRTIALDGDPMFHDVSLRTDYIGKNLAVFRCESISTTGTIDGIVRYYWVCTSHEGMNTRYASTYPEKYNYKPGRVDEYPCSYFFIDGRTGAYDTALEKGMVLTYNIYDTNHVLLRTVDIQL